MLPFYSKLFFPEVGALLLEHVKGLILAENGTPCLLIRSNDA